MDKTCPQYHEFSHCSPVENSLNSQEGLILSKFCSSRMSLFLLLGLEDPLGSALEFAEGWFLHTAGWARRPNLSQRISCLCLPRLLWVIFVLLSCPVIWHNFLLQSLACPVHWQGPYLQSLEILPLKTWSVELGGRGGLLFQGTVLFYSGPLPDFGLPCHHPDRHLVPGHGGGGALSGFWRLTQVWPSWFPIHWSYSFCSLGQSIKLLICRWSSNLWIKSCPYKVFTILATFLPPTDLCLWPSSLLSDMDCLLDPTLYFPSRFFTTDSFLFFHLREIPTPTLINHLPSFQRVPSAGIHVSV